MGLLYLINQMTEGREEGRKEGAGWRSMLLGFHLFTLSSSSVPHSPPVEVGFALRAMAVTAPVWRHWTSAPRTAPRAAVPSHPPPPGGRRNSYLGWTSKLLFWKTSPLEGQL
ncbi:hypothetical protein EYF80_043284 [Liparis tanakae]|uniref:Uncharacterized protein n=1 Tax=Liparis tanakae TaxID=230148 RepID=A0A4Z2G042_9TELE|nr:hypothetical protein EYF80_043284 [Liparis tanakae]